MRFSLNASFRASARAGIICLAAALAAPAALAQQGQATDAAEPYGWPWLVRALDHLKPSVDTSLPETPSQVAARLEDQIAAGQTRPALAEIARIEQEREQSGLSGVDARILFLKGRALARQGNLADAHAVYQDMTTRFPELPEPWNNLAAVQVAQGQVDAALHSLQMALMTDPNYGAAKANLADVHLMLAVRNYRNAAQLGIPDAAARAQQVRRILEGK